MDSLVKIILKIFFFQHYIFLHLIKQNYSNFEKRLVPKLSLSSKWFISFLKFFTVGIFVLFRKKKITIQQFFIVLGRFPSLGIFSSSFSSIAREKTKEKKRTDGKNRKLEKKNTDTPPSQTEK